tara:strand:- start:445 stop:753 length:309 start_codon:yes stop_codon:yes gene_type:complete
MGFNIMLITSKGYDGKVWTLYHTDKLGVVREVSEGETFQDFRGEPHIVQDGLAPHKPASQGKVWTQGGREFYPSVVDCKWVVVEPSVPNDPCDSSNSWVGVV